ncbi:TPA: CPBP family intramembrane metalloprotease, partial [Klebsiella pneumoniae]|nr:CPBP family intramembrane metalloprotease [Klebsiella pneumoniae]
VYGFLKNTLMCSTMTSVVLTSLIFLSLHWYYDILSLFILFFISVILTYARVLSYGILLPFILHSLMNGFVLFLRFQ